VRNTFESRLLAIGEATINVTSAGRPGRPAVLFLHGWPQDASAWWRILDRAAEDFHAVAIDLPGVGRSIEPRPDGSKSHLAARVSAVVDALRLGDVCVVGHDVGGMVAYALLRGRPWLRRAAILDTVIPGVPPWKDVIRNPYIWHFAFHAIPELPETLVRGREAAYFDYFYRVLSKKPISDGAKARYREAYAHDAALTQGFAFYRAFAKDAEENAAAARVPVKAPVLYVRGAGESGDIHAYVNGLREAGVENVTQALIPEAGHFTPDEAPDALWQVLKGFVLR
jgi:pimeloyl-ACP methyl ester carboxylesterase